MQQTKHGSNQRAKLSNRTAIEDKATNAFRSAGTCVLKDVKEHASLPINRAMCPNLRQRLRHCIPYESLTQDNGTETKSSFRRRSHPESSHGFVVDGVR